jgi:hypothetical protein
MGELYAPLAACGRGIDACKAITFKGYSGIDACE